MVDLLVQRLKKHRFKVDGIHGDMTQNQRERIISNLKDGNMNIVVATDVAARGIDVDGITLVVNYDVPDDVDSYIHRIGRTGRIGRKGEAWALVSRDDVPQLSKIIATHSLTVIETTAPELPEGVDKDPVSKQEDLAEFSDVYGMVKLGLETEMSLVKLSNFIIEGINCPELAIGDIKSNGNSKSVEVHSKFSSLAVRYLNSKGIETELLE
jgi:ATP-dependent RNA helicase DeaD